ncbi:MAG: type II toxin-antitoxin system HicA family toxin [Minisyncoccia bacterium]
MPRLRDISGKQMVRIFQTLGFVVLSQKGSHIKMSRVQGGKEQTLVIPNHTSISKGTLKTIYIQAGNYIPENQLKKLFYT